MSTPDTISILELRLYLEATKSKLVYLQRLIHDYDDPPLSICHSLEELVELANEIGVELERAHKNLSRVLPVR